MGRVIYLMLGSGQPPPGLENFFFQFFSLGQSRSGPYLNCTVFFLSLIGSELFTSSGSLRVTQHFSFQSISLIEKTFFAVDQESSFKKIWDNCDAWLEHFGQSCRHYLRCEKNLELLHVESVKKRSALKNVRGWYLNSDILQDTLSQK